MPVELTMLAYSVALLFVIVAGSMYPAVVVALAWAFLGERLRSRQVIGIVAALVGVALISLD